MSFRAHSSPPKLIIQFYGENFHSEWSRELCFGSHLFKSRDSSVGIALGYGLDDRSSSVQFPTGAGNSSLQHRVQDGSLAHPASCPMCTRGSFPGCKAAGA
jgi:hypothetical protein